MHAAPRTASDIGAAMQVCGGDWPNGSEARTGDSLHSRGARHDWTEIAQIEKCRFGPRNMVFSWREHAKMTFR